MVRPFAALVLVLVLSCAVCSGKRFSLGEYCAYRAALQYSLVSSFTHGGAIGCSTYPPMLYTGVTLTAAKRDSTRTCSAQAAAKGCSLSALTSDGRRVRTATQSFPASQVAALPRRTGDGRFVRTPVLQCHCEWLHSLACCRLRSLATNATNAMCTKAAQSR